MQEPLMMKYKSKLSSPWKKIQASGQVRRVLRLAEMYFSKSTFSYSFLLSLLEMNSPETTAWKLSIVFIVFCLISWLACSLAFLI